MHLSRCETPDHTRRDARQATVRPDRSDSVPAGIVKGLRAFGKFDDGEGVTRQAVLLDVEWRMEVAIRAPTAPRASLVSVVEFPECAALDAVVI